jgi:uncharacterized protein YjlB
MKGAKEIVERMTGWSRPEAARLSTLVRERQANEFRFADDGFIPNHPLWPLVVYRDAVSLPKEFDPAAVFEDLFERHGWGDSWRNGVFDYPHYHSRIHEVLGVARGSANVRFGGERGRTLAVKAGDVAVLPAGTGHQCLGASDDFLVVGAYPPSGTYDVCTKPEDRAAALQSIPKVRSPNDDPVYGTGGPLTQLWSRNHG